ncbi:hypothetical protein [Kribbella sp. NPDC051770]|uniref:hypothetical protein n=1 Tax=Kribbella sp. NPDC051770 TaxID=3155413 RepID=UPI0034232DE6
MTSDADAWATVAVRVRVPGLTAEEISRQVGLEVERSPRDPGVWVYDVPVGQERPLNEHLDGLEVLLAERGEQLGGLPEGREVDVVIGWSPKRGQDGMTLTPELVARLARLGAGVVTWTYTDHS